jgi:hypothetical protein
VRGAGIKHVAAMVDDIPGYQPLVLSPETAGLSCPYESRKTHSVVVFDHGSIAEPLIITDGVGSVTDESGTVTSGGRYYDAESLRKGRDAIVRGELPVLLSFQFEGDCSQKILTLTYRSSEGGLSVEYSLEDR